MLLGDNQNPGELKSIWQTENTESALANLFGK